MKRMRRILLSLVVITVAATAVVAGTRAFFSDTETSTGNIFAAGTIDLKIDHSRQTYNGVDCMTCSLVVVSDETNQVIDKTDSTGTYTYPTPQGAKEVSWIHDAWTATVPEGSKWIWATDPTTEYDALNEVTYTFKKTFEWWGPWEKADMDFSVASDNSVEVYLNGDYIGGYSEEDGYSDLTTISIPEINQGENVLEFKVTNWEPDWTVGEEPEKENPGGLLYKLTVEGECEDGYFEDFHAMCELWGFKKLEDEKFFNFNDVKPGDYGTNKISYHVYDNDAYLCMMVDNIGGRLNDVIEFAVWDGDTMLFGPDKFDKPGATVPIAEGGDPAIIASTDNYLDIHWCMGELSYPKIATTNGDNNTGYGGLHCDGSEVDNWYQGRKMIADLGFYVEQSRHNEEFTCVKIGTPE